MFFHNRVRSTAFVLAWAASVLCCASEVPAGQPADADDYTGPIELPDIARFAELPRRMYLDPDISIPPVIRFLEDATLNVLLRMVESGPDNQIRAEAARSLYTIQSMGLADLSSKSLRECLSQTDDVLLTQACASALAAIGDPETAVDVASVCRPEFEVLCLHVEPEFVSWGGDALKATWLNRIETPEKFSNTLIRLACDGLIQLKEKSAVATMETLLANPRFDFAVRHDAARAIGALDSLRAATIAESYLSGSVSDRLLAAAMLEHCESENGFLMLAQLCDDSSMAVASSGWDTMSKLRPEELLKRLDAGTVHPEPNVRFAVIRVLNGFPSPQHCDVLHRLTGDFHIGVRNAARRVLTSLAENDAELRGTILQNADASVLDSATSWQQLEQSLVVQGDLRHRELQDHWILLLEHDRPEVFTTAAWLLHLMPHYAAAEHIGQITADRYKLISSVHEADIRAPGLNAQVVFLFQHAGIVQLNSLQPLCEKQFSKAAPCDPETRAAGLWALGKINTGNPDPKLVPKLVERIFDDSPMDPEFFIVRRMCVLALAAMKARTTIPDMHRARDLYGTHEMLGETARWAIPQLGGEAIPEIQSIRRPYNSFPIQAL